MFPFSEHIRELQMAPWLAKPAGGKAWAEPWVILLLWYRLKGDSAFSPHEFLGLIAAGCISKMDKQEKG